MMGAHDPEAWAKSQLDEGIPQYARLVFLREAWKNVVSESDTTWIEGIIESSNQAPRGPGAGAGPVLSKMLASGISRSDLTELVRVMQWHVLAGLMYQLSDPTVVEYPSEDLPRVSWRLFEVDEDDKPLHSIDALHESVLDTEPSGREMRPAGVGREG
jgi:hypothetical protein